MYEGIFSNPHFNEQYIMNVHKYNQKGRETDDCLKITT